MPSHPIQARILLVWAFLFVPALFAQGATPTETLLPSTTRGFLCVTNMAQLEAAWNKTQLGQLMNDPLMKDFSTDLTGQIQERFADSYVKLGLTWDDIRDVPSGEVAMARIQPTPKEAALVMVADVTGRDKEVKALVEKITANLAKQDAKRTEENVGPVTLVQFDLPKQAGEVEVKQAFYIWTPQWLVISDHKGAILDILARIGGPGQTPSLAQVPAFQAVMARCQQAIGQRAPHARWFVEPFGYSDVLKIADPDRFTSRRKGKSIVDSLRDQGFKAVQGLGGVVDLASEGFENIHRTFVFAPPPYEKSAKMMVTPNREEFTPQNWVPRDVATYTTLYVDVLNAFDNFGPLFDELFGEGEKGVWEEVIDGLRNDPNGPQIDLRRDLIENLGQRATMITDYVLPITPDSERMVYAIETKNEKAVAEAIRKAMQNDPTVRKREFEGHIIWETVQQTGGKPLPKPKVEIGGIPSLGPEKKAEREAERLLPTAAVTVAHGQLFVASHIEFLKDILLQPAKGDSLATRLDYKLVSATLDQFGVPANCARSFSRTDEEYRATYELIRQGKMPQSKTMFGRLINQMLASGKKGVVRKQEIDGTKMPDYQVVRRYLGPAGMMTTSEPTGWFVIGFTLKK